MRRTATLRAPLSRQAALLLWSCILLSTPVRSRDLLKETLAAILDGRQVNIARRKLGEWIDWGTRYRLEPSPRRLSTRSAGCGLHSSD